LESDVHDLTRLGIALVLASFGGAAFVAACSASGDDNEPSGSGSGNGSAAGGSGGGVGGGSGGFNNTGGGNTSCIETSAEAMTGPLPADIIFVVDNSGSMSDEATFVQASMNDFSNIMVGSGIDFHVILISADSSDSNGICVPTPLGSGNCPADENLPSFHHVPQSVGSSNPLQIILSTYPQWQSSLRLGSSKTIAVISDDDSAIDAATFTNDLLLLDPSFQDFTFHAIVAPYELSTLDEFACIAAMPPNCGSVDVCCGVNSSIGLFCNPLPADTGAVYMDLVTQTGGVLGNLCTQNFVPVFQQMATEVVAAAQVPCVYDIPPAPSNEAIDFSKVNVEYKPDANAAPQQIFNVPGGQADCGADGGWYYDDANSPTKIILCPSTCQVVQNGSMPAVSVKFGCATVIK
jgi:hypothetical protein